MLRFVGCNPYLIESFARKKAEWMSEQEVDGARGRFPALALAGLY
jgi:hypothetical protein